MPLKKYDKKLDYSYTYGVFPTLDLFKYKKEQIIKIILNTQGIRNEGYHELEELSKQNNIRIEYDNKAIKSISAKENTYAIGVFQKYNSEVETGKNHIVLVNPSNTGNIGTIIRTMAGFNLKNLVLIKPAVDIFDPKVVRSSMGSIFNLNYEYIDNFEMYINKYANRNLYTFMLDGTTPLQNVKFEKPYSLVFGNESQGLDEKYLELGQSVYIPHSKAIDSLNLSVAVSLGIYEASK